MLFLFIGPKEEGIEYLLKNQTFINNYFNSVAFDKIVLMEKYILEIFMINIIKNIFNHIFHLYFKHELGLIIAPIYLEEYMNKTFFN